MNWDSLIAAAQRARSVAYAPYSGFRVGAAVATVDDRMFSGCNIENRSFGATLCAERVAVAAAVAGGATKLAAVAVMTDASPPGLPCGLCLQVLAEFGTPDLPILLVNPEGDRREHRFDELHPHPFELPKGGLGNLRRD
jgi:cytidine deaminase